ncbi:MAG TPA: signal peptidase I [Gemmatimonadaceae bacterium]|nr:signal peptidase I [Gemmatimonadaceae bacterium]
MAKTARKSASKSSKPANVVAQARANSGQKKNSQPAGKWLWENFKSLAGAVLIYLFVKTLFIEAFRIPSGSMIPTLLIGDWLFVNKLAYGPSIPFTNAHLPGYTQPKHDDVIVFISPYQADNAPDFTPTLVKRLKGMPGDTLYMRNGLLYLDGLPQRQGFTGTNPIQNDTAVNADFDWQHSIEIKNSRFGPPPAQPTLGNWGPLVIPKDHYFMMGDNRYCSKDSRYWGVVPKENIRGRPLFVYYSYTPNPPDNVDELNCAGTTTDRPLPFITAIRWTRLGHIIK